MFQMTTHLNYNKMYIDIYKNSNACFELIERDHFDENHDMA